MNPLSMAVKALYISALFAASALNAQTLTKTPVKSFYDSKSKVRSRLILDNKEVFNSKKVQAPQGPRTGGGGNSCALAISQNTNVLLDLLNLAEVSDTLKISPDKLLPVIKNAQFFIAADLTKDGQVKDAKNYPDEMKIVLTPGFCNREMIEVSGRSISLLFHEYLGLAKIDDQKYQLSGALLKLYAELQTKNLEVQRYLQNESAKDMKGQKSCFGGALLKMDKKMADEYGRYRPGEKIALEIMSTDSERSRNMDTYCSSPDSENLSTCEANDFDSYVAKADFGYADAGSLGTKSLLFKVERTVKTTKVVDHKAGWFAEGADLKSEKIIEKWKCTRMK